MGGIWGLRVRLGEYVCRGGGWGVGVGVGSMCVWGWGGEYVCRDGGWGVCV